MTDLADRVVLSRTRGSRLVDDMAAAGLLVREQNPHDGRPAYAALTDLGLRRYRQAALAYLAGIEEHLAQRLTDRELGLLARTLQQVLAASDTGRGRRALDAGGPTGPDGGTAPARSSEVPVSRTTSAHVPERVVRGRARGRCR